MSFTDLEYDQHPATGGRPRRRGRRGLVVFVLVALGEIMLVAAAAAWLVSDARAEFEQARALATDGQVSARAIDLDAAETAFVSAAEHFEAGSARLANPLVRVLGVVPGLRENLAAARALGEAGTEVSVAAGGLVMVINEQPDGLRSFLPDDGAFPVTRLALLADEATQAEQRLQRAADIAAAAPRDRLIDSVARAQQQFDEQLGQARSLVGSTAGASRALAVFMGGEGKRRYLFGAQSPAELRGTGGYIGAYAIATFDDGTFRLSRFAPIQDLQNFPVSKVPPPNADYATRYNRYGGAGFWPGINATPDFPSAARAILALYERSEDVELDGVVVVDPFALQALLRLVGEVQVPDIGVVDERNVVPVVANEAYGELGTESRKEVLGAVAAGALDSLLRGAGSTDPAKLLSTLTPVASNRHILMHSTDPQVQRTLEEMGLAGALPEPDNDTVSVVVNNAGINKVDFYVDRTVRYRVSLADDGSATARLRVTFANRAPASGPGGYVLGPHVDGLAAGDNLSLVSVFCGRCSPAKATPRLVDGDRTDKGFVVEEELGHTVATTLLTVPRGDKRTVKLSWDLEDAWDPAGDGCYALDYVEQTTIRNTKLVVRVEPPPGYTPQAAGEVSADGEVHSGPIRGPINQRVCFTKPPGAQ